MDQPKEKKMETLRNSFTTDGQRVFLMFDESRGLYRLATRWAWLSSFDSIWDACDAFEAVEFMEGDLRHVSKISKSEISRVPRHRFGSRRGTMSRINYLINCIERRIAGLRPVICGSKGSVEKWIPA